MKLAFLLTWLITLPTFATDYIVKLRPRKKLNIKTNFKEIKTSFGTYYKISGDQKSVLSNLKKSSDVLYIEPNYIYKISPISTAEQKSNNDESFSKQWGLHNTGYNYHEWKSLGIAGRDINALKAWEITKGSQEVKIAVIDTGVDYNHPDLKDQIWINEAELNGQKGIDDDGNGFIDDIHGYDFANKDSDPMDDFGHGTHCAGVIGAAHNDIGIAGVMAKVKIVAIKFITESGTGTTEDAILAIDYAIKVGVNVISNSWGGVDHSQALKDAISAANLAGIVFVVAAGNDTNNNDVRPSYPANYNVDNVISVGSMDGRGRRSYFSNYGKKSVHVFAPGSGIYSTFKDGTYQSLSGTSMACPHVTGIVGLLKSYEPNLSVLEIRERLIKTSVPSTHLRSSVAKGWVDAYRALTNTID